MPGIHNLISFSGGRSSAMMLKMLIDSGIENYTVVFANTGKEKNETLDFVNECSVKWSIPITWIEYTNEKPLFKIVDYSTASRNGEPFEMIINRNPKYLPNATQRFCTGDLKIKPMKRFMKSKGFKYWNCFIGIRYDEPLRWGKYLPNQQKEPWFYIMPLYEKKINKNSVFYFWRKQNFDLKINSHAGNCDLCFMKGRHKIISLIRENNALADWWIKQEKQTGATFRKGLSYAQMKEMANVPEFNFENELDYPCFCDL